MGHARYGARRALGIDAIVEALALDNGDLAFDCIAMPRQPSGRIAHGARFRQRQRHRHPACLIAGQTRRAMAEIPLGPGLCAIGANAGFRDIEINFHNPVLAPHRFDPEGEPRLQTFAKISAILPPARSILLNLE